MGHTLRGCVDWNWKHTVRFSTILVTPCVGVWIETISFAPLDNFVGSHPAWVCGLKHVCLAYFGCQIGSHPAWVCGLKPSSGTTGGWSLCHTLRGCVDWNSDSNIDTLAVDSHTLRGCVDWNSWCDTVSVIWRSHTLRGCVDWNPWKEKISCCCSSHPAWVCGLKLTGRWYPIWRTESHPAWVCGLKLY